MRKREMKVGMKVRDSEFKEWRIGTIVEMSHGRILVEFKTRRSDSKTSYSPAEYKFLKKAEA
jgi:hypothetical protein